MLLGTRGLTVWAIVNVFASAVFIHLASWTWLEPNLRDEAVARAGDAVVWMMLAFPVLGAAAVGNAVWLLLVSRERRRRSEAWPVSTVSLIATIWICALAVDHFRSLGF